MLSRRTLTSALAAGAGLAAAPRLAHGEPRFASAWSEASHSAIRLIAGGNGAAGIEFRLAENYKTYWRDPGDSGVPPSFDWSGSSNLERVEIFWPAPQRFMDGAGFSIGYKKSFVLPLRATPAQAGGPVGLRLKIDYAVCDTMCIPAQGAAQLAPPLAGGSPHAAAIEEATRRVPVRLGPNANASPDLAFGPVALIEGSPPKLDVMARTPRDAARADLFVEGPRGSFFGKPAIETPAEQPRSATAVNRRFLSPIEQRAEGLSRWPLVLTLVVDGRGVEWTTEIDAPR